jgi:hypothetical protein
MCRLDIYIIMEGQVTVMKDGQIICDEEGEPLLLEKGAVFGEETLLHVVRLAVAPPN